MNPEHFWLALIIFFTILLILNPNCEALVMILIFILFFTFAYIGPFEPTELPENVFKTMLGFGLVWFFVDFILGIPFFKWLFMIPSTDAFIASFEFWIPFLLVFFGIIGLIEHGLKKKIKGSQ